MLTVNLVFILRYNVFSNRNVNSAAACLSVFILYKHKVRRDACDTR